jgi:ABC-2 type transport system ATP-binding protein
VVGVLAVEVRDLVKVYSGGVTALNGISFDVEEGVSHAVLGPNGAGKTTLIRIITTQIKPTKGGVRVFGFDVVSQASRVRELLAYVPQEMSLWTELTGFENALIYAKIYGIESSRRREVIEEVLEFMELKEAANRLVRTYSGGMIRRLEIAIALMRKPRLLVLDEPTIGLDPRARLAVWEKLKEYKREYGTTMFFATHYMDEGDKYADKVTLIARGKIVAEGTPTELKELYGVDKIILRINGDPEKARRALSEMKLNPEFNSKGEISIPVKNPAVILPKIMESLYNIGVGVVEARVSEASLDDVFIKLTGRGISGEESGRAVDVLSTRRMIRRGG